MPNREEGVPSASYEITGLLRQWSAGDKSARDRLIPLLYDRLRELAHRRLGGAPLENSLNTTELVHEAYIRLVDAPRVDLPDRAHFLALASEIMRNLLVDRARARLAAKRGGGMRRLDLDEFEWISDENLETVAELEADIGLPTGSLQSTVGAYNGAAERGEDPLLHKKPEWCRPIGTPVGAIDLRASCAGFTLGGLLTTLDAEVLHVSGDPIPGLFAAGRATSGLAAWGYASGVSLGDGSFYGRRAGRSAAKG